MNNNIQQNQYRIFFFKEKHVVFLLCHHADTNTLNYDIFHIPFHFYKDPHH